VVPLDEDDQALPFQCAIAPPTPTAQTSLVPLPHTPENPAEVPLGEEDQALPFQCTMVPNSPTAQTSLAPLPHTL
jgi:hypothetical protein